MIQGQGPSRAQLGGGISDGEESDSDYSSDGDSSEGTESGTESEAGDVRKTSHVRHRHHNVHVLMRQMKKISKKSQKITKWLRLVSEERERFKNIHV